MFASHEALQVSWEVSPRGREVPAGHFDVGLVPGADARARDQPQRDSRVRFTREHEPLLRPLNADVLPHTLLAWRCTTVQVE